MAIRQSIKPAQRPAAAPAAKKPLPTIRTLPVWLVTSAATGDKVAYLTPAEARNYAKRWREHTGERCRVVPMVATLTPAKGGRHDPQ